MLARCSDTLPDSLYKLLCRVFGNIITEYESDRDFRKEDYVLNIAGSDIGFAVFYNKIAVGLDVWVAIEHPVLDRVADMMDIVHGDIRYNFYRSSVEKWEEYLSYSDEEWRLWTEMV